MIFGSLIGMRCEFGHIPQIIVGGFKNIRISNTTFLYAGFQGHGELVLDRKRHLLVPSEVRK
jgi:hypothetical protein